MVKGFRQYSEEDTSERAREDRLIYDSSLPLRRRVMAE